MADRKKTPLFQSIAQALRADIAEGAYPPRSMLPTEASLAARFGVNRHTVRHALALLAEEGLVAARRGRGVTVIGRPVDYRLGARVRFHQNLLAEGLAPEKRVLSVELRAATEEHARVLKLPAGAPVCRYDAVSLADGSPIAVVRSLFPEARLPGLAAALGRSSSVTKALAEVGVADYERASTRLTAERATPTIALHLELSEGDPLIRAYSVNVDTAGRVVEYGQAWFAGDRVMLSVDRESFGA